MVSLIISCWSNKESGGALCSASAFSFSAFSAARAASRNSICVAWRLIVHQQPWSSPRPRLPAPRRTPRPARDCRLCCKEQQAMNGELVHTTGAWAAPPRHCTPQSPPAARAWCRARPAVPRRCGYFPRCTSPPHRGTAPRAAAARQARLPAHAARRGGLRRNRAAPVTRALQSWLDPASCQDTEQRDCDCVRTFCHKRAHPATPPAACRSSCARHMPPPALRHSASAGRCGLACTRHTSAGCRH